MARNFKKFYHKLLIISSIFGGPTWVAYYFTKEQFPHNIMYIFDLLGTEKGRKHTSHSMFALQMGIISFPNTNCKFIGDILKFVISFHSA